MNLNSCGDRRRSPGWWCKGLSEIFLGGLEFGES